MFERTIRGIGGLVVAFIALPIVVVIPLSFSSAPFLSFPPPGFSWRWYQEFFADDRWIRATTFSVQVGAVVMVVATVLGTLAALSLVRGDYAGRTLISTFLISPMVMPLIISGVAMYFVLTKLGLVDTFWGLVIAHSVLALPRVVVLMTSVLQRVDRLLEHAATTLGATPAQAFVLVTLPIILPGVVSAAIIAFLASFDEIIVALFISGPRSTTLPKRMWDSLTTELTPVIAVVSTLLLAAVVALFAALQAARSVEWGGAWELTRWRRARRSAPDTLSAEE